jgi:predicted component of type VI protein secretion system
MEKSRGGVAPQAIVRFKARAVPRFVGAMAEFIDADRTRWSKVIQARNLSPD